jgi:hypothetical protein
VIEVLNPVGVEGELVVGIGRLAGVEITAEKSMDLSFGRAASGLGFRRYDRRAECGS